MALAVGFAARTGWTIAVVIDGRTVVDTPCLDIAPTSVDRQVFRAAIEGLPLELPDVGGVLANHRLMHAVEGDLYRVTLAEACAARGGPVVHAHPKDPDAEIEGWKGASTSPWTKDHRLAAAVAVRSAAS